MTAHHDSPPWQSTMTSYHDSPPWQPTMTSYHDSPPWHPTMTAHHDNPPWHPTMTANCDILPWQLTVTSYHDSPPWHPTMTANCDILPWQPTMTVHHDILPWQPTLIANDNRECHHVSPLWQLIVTSNCYISVRNNIQKTQWLTEQNYFCNYHTSGGLLHYWILAHNLFKHLRIKIWKINTWTRKISLYLSQMRIKKCIMQASCEQNTLILLFLIQDIDHIKVHKANNLFII